MECVFRKAGKFPDRTGKRMAFVELMHRSRRKRNLFGNLGSVSGEEWWGHRRKVNNIIMKRTSAHPYLEDQCRVAEEMMGWIKSNLTSDGDLNEDLFRVLNKFALSAISLVLFNEDLGYFRTGSVGQSIDYPVGQSPDEFLDNVYRWFTLGAALQLRAKFSRINWTKTERDFFAADQALISYAEAALSKSLQSGDASDFIRQLWKREDLDSRDKLAIVLDMLNGGVDSTGASAAWLLYNLARNPAAQERLRREIAETVGMSASIEAALLDRLPYLAAAVKESFRLTPINVGTSRVLAEDVALGGYLVPAGTNAVISYCVTCHQEKYFTDAHLYRPERWLRDGTAQRIHPFSVLPFGHGLRMCVGRRFADQELKVIVIKILQHFRIEFRGEEAKPKTGLFNHPDRPMLFRFVSGERDEKERERERAP